MSHSAKEENELILIINNLFESCQSHYLYSIKCLSNESLVKSILVEIEPTFDRMLIDTYGQGLVTEQEKLETFKTILDSIYIYLDKNPEKHRLHKQPKIIRDSFKIKELVEENEEQLLLFASILLLLSSICSNRDCFLDRVSSMDEDYQFLYLKWVEKYLNTNSNLESIPEINENLVSDRDLEDNKHEVSSRKNSEESNNNVRGITENSELSNTETIRKPGPYRVDERRQTAILRANFLVESQMARRLKEFDQQKKEIQEILEQENEKLKEEICQKNRLIMDYQNKIKEDNKEIEFFKGLQNEIVEKDTEDIINLKERLTQKDLEIENLKADALERLKKNEEEHEELKNKESQYLALQKNYKVIEKKYKRLEGQLVDYDKLKDKVLDYDNLVVNLQACKIQIDHYENEIGSFKLNMEKLKKDLNEEREKAQKIEFEKREIEIAFADLEEQIRLLETENSEIKKKESRQPKVSFFALPSLKQRTSSKFILSEQFSSDFKNKSISRFSVANVINDEETVFNNNSFGEHEDKVKELESIKQNLQIAESDLLIIKKEKEDILKTSGEQSEKIFMLIEERDKNISEIDDLKFEIANLQREKEDILTNNEIKEKEITQNFTQKISVLEEKVKSLKEEEKNFKLKIDILNKVKNNCLKECQHLKLQLGVLKSNNENLELEKKVISDELNKEKESNKKHEPTHNNFNTNLENLAHFTSIISNSSDSHRSNTQISTVQHPLAKKKSKILLPLYTLSKRNTLTNINENESSVHYRLSEELKTNSEGPIKTLMESFKLENEALRNEINVLKKEQSDINFTSQTLSNEIITLKITLNNKEEMINCLKQELEKLNKEITRLNKKIEEDIDTYNKELRKRTDDIEFLKVSFEEQSNRVESEHVMITNCLYELATQFMNFKNEVTKRTNANEEDDLSRTSEVNSNNSLPDT